MRFLAQRLWTIILAGLIVPCFCGTAFGSASNVYITRDGAGAKNGTNLANAGACDAAPGTAQSTCAFFNNGSNWGSGSTQIGAGTVVHLGGDGVAITATAGASGYLAFQGSGTSGNVITLLFDSGFSPSGLNAPYWCCGVGGGAISTGSNKYILIDGGVPCGTNTANPNGPTQPNPCNGTIQATANGDGRTYSQESTAILASGGCNNLEIRNLGIYNMFVKSNISMSGPSNSVNVFCDNDSQNFLLHDNQFHDMQSAVVMVPFGGTNSWQLYNNDFYNMNWGIITAAGANSTVSSIYVYGNHIHDMANWTTSSNQYHHDGMYWFYASSSTGGLTFTAAYVYNNVFDGNNTNGACSGCDMTSYWYSDQSDTYTAAYIFNNVFVATDNTPSSAGPFLMGFSPYAGTGYIFNNTFSCNPSSGGYTTMAAGGAGSSGGTVRITGLNNAFSSCEGWWVMSSGSASWSSGGLNNNVYAHCGSTNCWQYHSNYWANLSQWQSGTGQDSNAASTSGSLNTGGSYNNNSRSPIGGLVPQSNSIAHLGGQNLYSSICNTLSGISSSLGAACRADITGSSRPSSGAWDSGALQSQSSDPPSVNPPTSLSATVL